MSTRKKGVVTVVIWQFERASNSGEVHALGAVKRTLYETRTLAARAVGCATAPLAWQPIEYVEMNGERWPVCPVRATVDPGGIKAGPAYPGIYEISLPHGATIPADLDASAWALAEKSVGSHLNFGDRTAAIAKLLLA